MKSIASLNFILFSCVISFSQTIIFQDDFDSYIINQGIASQTSDWHTWSIGSGAVIEDAHASDDYAASPLNSMKIINDRDMAYKFGNISTGHYSIEFNALFHEQGYFSLQHDEGSNWAMNILVNYSNEIWYQDEYYISDVDTVGTYVTDQWTHFKFEINFELDTIFFFVDNVLAHSSTFSKSVNSTPSLNLDIINFYGLSGLNGVINSYYYIDDFKVVDLAHTAVISDYEKKEISIFPNPAKDVVTINTIDNLKDILIYDMSGKIVHHEILTGTKYQFSLGALSSGIYTIQITTETETTTEKLIVQ